MSGEKATGYDKYIDWKIFVIPLVLLILILAMPATRGMKDVGTEYALGEKQVWKFLGQELFQKDVTDLEQWQLLTVRMMEKSVYTKATSREKFLKRDLKWCKKNGVPADEKNLTRALDYVRDSLDDERFKGLILDAAAVRFEKIRYEELSEKDRASADKGVWKLKVALAMMAFVVICFVTGCIPLPIVAFCTGLLLVFTGVVSREEVAALYWSDSVWFIMGSLMFAAAFVKTGVDRRIALFLFSKLATPSTGAITLVLILVIAPLASFISDHALAAIFLPIAVILYRGSQGVTEKPDIELGKMLMITVAMACNIGGFGAPSGGARNVIMISYLNDMFGMDIGYLQWMIYGMPFVIIMIPLTWLMIRWRFKPATRDLTPAMTYLREDISRMGKWDRKQITAVAIFLVMITVWFTEKTLYDAGIFPIRLGIGVPAIAGAVAYVLFGVVNWRDYHEKVDWGVVWLYAGAIIFGNMLDSSGAAYFLARTSLDLLRPLGFNEGIPMLAVGGGLTALLTQIMADGPAAAAIGPITLNMAGITHPGTIMVPFMALVTACCSSFAYCLIIGTPPNAIVYASGYLEPKDFLRVGIPMWIIAMVVILLLVRFYWMFLGFGGLPGI